MTDKNEVQIDVNQVVNSLLEQIGQQAKEIAMLKVQLAAVANPSEEVEPKEVKNE